MSSRITHLSDDSTSQTTPVYLSPGWHEFTFVAATPTGVAVTIQKGNSSSAADMVVADKDGNEVSLSEASPCVLVASTGQFFAVTRAGGSGNVTVTSELLENTK